QFVVVYKLRKIYFNPCSSVTRYQMERNGGSYFYLVEMDDGEKLVKCVPVRAYHKEQFIIFCTKQGMIKKSSLDLYETSRHSRSLIALNLNKEDEVINVFATDGSENILLAT